MIFLTVGSQKFQFNRLLKEVDRLVENKEIDEEVFAQIGYSDYYPRNYNFEKFLDRDQFNHFMDSCNIVITHAGTGAIIGALKKDKKVIAVPRLEKFGEHVDDHQLEILNQFSNMNFLYKVEKIEDLKDAINNIYLKSFNKYESNTENIIYSLKEFISK